MAGSLVQFRYDESSRIKAATICMRLGIDLQTYMKMSLNRPIQENGVPFSMTIGKKASQRRFLSAMRRANRIAEANGIEDMTLEEITAEIVEARR